MSRQEISLCSARFLFINLSPLIRICAKRLADKATELGSNKARDTLLGKGNMQLLSRLESGNFYSSICICIIERHIKRENVVWEN